PRARRADRRPRRRGGARRVRALPAAHAGSHDDHHLAPLPHGPHGRSHPRRRRRRDPGGRHPRRAPRGGEDLRAALPAPGAGVLLTREAEDHARSAVLRLRRSAMRTVKKITPESDGWYLDEDDEADEQTLERRVRVGSPEPSLFANHLTKRVETLDERLLAIARGEIEPAESSSPSAASM